MLRREKGSFTNVLMLCGAGVVCAFILGGCQATENAKTWTQDTMQGIKNAAPKPQLFRHGAPEVNRRDKRR